MACSRSSPAKHGFFPTPVVWPNMVLCSLLAWVAFFVKEDFVFKSHTVYVSFENTPSPTATAFDRSDWASFLTECIQIW